jgi:hypothetical protein
MLAVLIIPDRLISSGIPLSLLPLMRDFGGASCCKVSRRCRTPPPRTALLGRKPAAALASSETPNCRIPAPLIPDIAAISGIWRAEIPTINGSNPANEDFSGSFRQHDSG